ncbi:MAG: hypothetical protein WCP24_03740, partial [bacterium]
CWSPAVSDKAWGPTGVITGVQGNTDGAANTTDLVAIAGNNYPAAEYCDGLDQGGHQDWYLPAKQQLIDGLTNQFVTPGGTVTGFVVGTGYWSSTERSDGPGNDARYAGYYYGAVNSYSNSKDGINLQTRCLR